MRILFIGNSFTYYNDMPTAIFKKIAEQNGREVTVDSVTVGGWSLLKYYEGGDEHSERVRKALKEKPDIVILQEQSHSPISAPEDFYRATRGLVEMAREVGATPYLYATWGYKAGHKSLPEYGTSTADMEMKLRKSYMKIGEELGACVCHAGAAMTYAYGESDLELYGADNYHPALCGSAVAALTIYATVFNVDPQSLSLDLDGISDSDAEEIKRVAHKAIFERD